ncbi:DNA cytosine methyltransferase [Pseudomonas sp. DCB_CB]|uniref:DNA cytosine methyltransferase n=1 Tax=unclassified Pseudomonas TaxID=196821 RepID=UPI002248A36D|nr:MULTISPECIES: DNA cytosine methyltransferase [unclassified Pseudomonas]MCX2694975.1 DNA cytosine methyltransferase [Pseudomonas sp. DCB_BZ]MCX2860066.1 DNA cytosine methyltransferase [Pseudomonas sp. DCB_CB]
MTSAALLDNRLTETARQIHFQTQYQLPLTAADDELIVDYFCGGGGASTGLEMGLGRLVSIAKNHDAAAISMHQANHRHALHLQTDVFSGDPRVETGGRRVAWFHMSPDCRHFSQAKGGQPRSKEIRDLSWIGCKWAGRVKPRVISLENVEAILGWTRLIAKRDKTTGRVIKLVPYLSKGKVKTRQVVAAPGERVPVQEQFLIPDPKRIGATWRRFVRQLEALGYVVEWKTLRACDYGAPTIRKRLYMIARSDGHPIVWPEQTHFKNPTDWQLPHPQMADCIDWSVKSKSVWGRSKPLAEATMRRIAKGMTRYVLDSADPFIVPIANWSKGDRVHSIREPLRAVTAWPKGGSFAVVSPVIAPLTHQGADRVCAPREPLPTVTAANRGELALFTAFLAQANGGFNTTAAHDLRCPVSTITNTGSQQQLISTGLVAGDSSLTAEQEAGALRVASFLMAYYSTGGQWAALNRPLNTITTKDRLALVTVYLKGSPYVIVDIQMRMLKPHELYRAQGFPVNYIFDRGHDGRKLTNTEQVRMCGNSVCPPVIAALASANDPWKYSVLEALAA